MTGLRASESHPGSESESGYHPGPVTVARRRHHGPAEGSGGWQVLSLPLRVGTHRAVDAARVFIETYLFPKLDGILSKRLWQDAKSTLQEKMQDAESATPYYSVIKETGPDHDKHFTVGVYVKDTLVAQGDGKSKQEAEQTAAKAALDSRGW